MQKRHADDKRKEVVDDGVEGLVHERLPRHVRHGPQLVVDEQLRRHHHKAWPAGPAGHGEAARAVGGKCRWVPASSRRRIRRPHDKKECKLTKRIDKAHERVEHVRVPALVGLVHQRIDGVTNHQRHDRVREVPEGSLAGSESGGGKRSAQTGRRSASLARGAPDRHCALAAPTSSCSLVLDVYEPRSLNEIHGNGPPKSTWWAPAKTHAPSFVSGAAGRQSRHPFQEVRAPPAPCGEAAAPTPRRHRP